MTIEIADRLVKLRKKYGYSQEELADKLGLSRQAVSKWERAEASPDTDNLICLAKLYGVSLDELLATDEDIDTIVEEQVKEEAPAQDAQEEVKKDKVEINDDGVVIFSKKGKKVTINDDDVTCYNADGTVKKHEINKTTAIIGAIEATLMMFAVVAYIVLSATKEWWHIMWIVFFVPDIICSIARCIQHRNANKFNMAFVATFTFFLVCWFIPQVNASFPNDLWHPMWTVFLAIPAYHSLCGSINKVLGKSDDDDKDDDEDKDEDKD